MTTFTALLDNYATASLTRNAEKVASAMTSLQNECNVLNGKKVYKTAESVRELYTTKTNCGMICKFIVKTGKEVRNDELCDYVAIEQRYTFVPMTIKKGTKKNPSSEYVDFQKLYNLFWLASYESLRTEKTVSMNQLKDSLKTFVDSFTKDSIYIGKNHVKFILAQFMKEGQFTNQSKDYKETAFLRIISKVVAMSLNNMMFDYYDSEETKNTVFEKLYF